MFLLLPVSKNAFQNRINPRRMPKLPYALGVFLETEKNDLRTTTFFEISSLILPPISLLLSQRNFDFMVHQFH
jgi:hypothetical protein